MPFSPNRFHRNALLSSEVCVTDRGSPEDSVYSRIDKQEVWRLDCLCCFPCGQNSQVFFFFLIKNNASNYLASYSTYITETDKSTMFSC